jgi:hypothetical protein
MLLIESIDESVFNKLNITKKPSTELTDMTRIKLALAIFGRTVCNDLKCMPSNNILSTVLELDPDRIVRRMAYDKDNNNLFNNDMNVCRHTFDRELKSAFYDKKKKNYYPRFHHLFKFKLQSKCEVKTLRASKYLFIYSPRTSLSEKEIGVIESIIADWDNWDNWYDSNNPSGNRGVEFIQPVQKEQKEHKQDELQIMIPNTDNDYTFRVLKGKVYQIDPLKEYKIINDVLCHYTPVKALEK